MGQNEQTKETINKLMNENETFKERDRGQKPGFIYSSSSMSISLSDSQNPSEERDRDSSDSFEPSLAVLKRKRSRSCNYDVIKNEL